MDSGGNTTESRKAPVADETELDIKSFRLQDGSVDGEGLSEEFASGDWPRLFEVIYEVAPRDEGFDGDA